jgi:hypothetical protein
VYQFEPGPKDPGFFIAPMLLLIVGDCMNTKICSRCRVEKSLTDFGARPSRPDGHKYVCKRCEADARNISYAKNPEKFKADNLRLSVIPSSRFSRFKKRCKLAGTNMELAFEQWSDLVLNKPCHYCNGALETKGCSLDRKDNSLGYTVTNVVACCKECNRLKGPTLTYEEMLAVSKILKEVRSVK